MIRAAGSISLVFKLPRVIAKHSLLAIAAFIRSRGSFAPAGGCVNTNRNHQTTAVRRAVAAQPKYYKIYNSAYSFRYVTDFLTCRFKNSNAERNFELLKT
ncbi:hypothetical protein [Paraburkholderia tropica]|uniref:hypothetical protein n=1 Tax=Paraburkholderia tropica TaxID=92647 RepID=UPI002AB293D4|nr:hypothetical protein [Paraburkholderia tropica]